MTIFCQISRKIIEENTHAEGKAHDEIKTEVRSTTIPKKSALNLGNFSALTIYKRAQPEIKFAQKVQNGDIFRESVVQIK